MNLIDQGHDSTGRQAQGQRDGLVGFTGVARHLIVVGNFGQLVGIEEDGLSVVDSLLVGGEHVAKLLTVEVFVVGVIHIYIY